MGFLSRTIDSAIATVSPVSAARRMRAREALSGKRSYDASKIGDAILAKLKIPRTSADAELYLTGHTLRARAWELYRNNPAAKAITEAWVSLIVGTGIDIEPMSPNKEWNKKIRRAWKDWCEDSSADGRSDFFEQQRQHCRSEFAAGEALWRYVALSDTNRLIPSAIQAMEPDQISDYAFDGVDSRHQFRQGVEVDLYGRPQFLHLLARHPGDYPFPAWLPKGSRVSAADLQHTFDQSRAGQTRGESKLAVLVTILCQEKELIDAELTAAKIGAAFAVFIATTAQTDESEDGFGLATGEDSTDAQGNRFSRIEPGAIMQGAPGEDPKVIANTRPSQQVAPFRDGLRGDLAGGSLVPRRFIDRDVSKANYSSMRCDMIDTKRLLVPIQRRFGRATAIRTYRQILPELCIAAGVPFPRERSERRAFQRCEMILPGWEYVDPLKDIVAVIKGVGAGITTLRDELGGRGDDWRDVLDEQVVEREAYESAGIAYPSEEPAQPEQDADKSNDKEAANAQ